MVRSVRRMVRTQKNHPEGWLIVKLMLVWLQMHFQLSGQPNFVDLALVESLKQKAGGAGKGATTGDPVEDGSGGTPRNEGKVFVADVVAVEKRLKVGHRRMSSSTKSSGLELRKDLYCMYRALDISRARHPQDLVVP